MADWNRYLPLSNRGGDDESAVGQAWAPATSDLLLAIAAALDADPALIAAPTLRASVTVDAATRELLTGLHRSFWQRMAARLGTVATPSAEVAALAPGRRAAALRDEAARRRASTRRTRVRDLGAVLVLALDLRASTGAAIEVDPFLCGAVALDLALRSRTPQRSVVTARTMVATDSDWRVGRGPELSATAASIVLFLAGRAGFPSAD
jgi:hypothetical protein